ncbi:MAG: IclR family transcriptional regulator, partial [Nocardioides sp.]|uniref:IclR family transcriptional regulator n=1 Tax=Nocardioides sp. TaxID=35761 RepID=UPI0039E4E46F
MGQVPAATKTLRVLRHLASQVDPVPLESIMRACDLPRSSAYHLVNAMIGEGFVVHLAEEHRYGLGVAAFEVGSGYLRQEPLQRLARRSLARLVDEIVHSAHLAVLDGRDVLYVVEERAPGRPSLVTDVGVRLPSHLTASGRAMLAELPPAQVRALYPDRTAFADRTGVGPQSPTALRSLLAETRRRGHAVEDGEVTAGLASVAAA